MLELYEVEYQALVDPETPDRSKLMGKVADRAEARVLMGHMPGRGGCFLWDPESKRVVEIINWERGTPAN